MYKVRELARPIDNFDLRKGIVELNIMIFCIVDLALKHDYEALIEAVPDFVEQFATIMAYAHKDDPQALQAVGQDVAKVAAIFEAQPLEKACDSYAYDIGLNSESDMNYTAAARSVATLGFFIRLSEISEIEFDFE